MGGAIVPGVGGVPDSIATGATRLGKTANAISACTSVYRTSCSRGSAAAGDAAVSSALERFQAAFARYSIGLTAQFGALCMLAQHSAEDLATAGGTGPASPRGPR